jgi:hypothetical protein
MQAVKNPAAFFLHVMNQTMRRFWIFAFLLLLAEFEPAAAQPISDNTLGTLRIDWEVKNRFRLFRGEADFRRHVAAWRGDGILAAEARLEQAADGRGWARDTVERLCVDATGRLTENCQRDGTRESYLNPADHRIGATLAGMVPPGSRCVWNFDDGTIPPQEIAAACSEEVRLRVRYGKPTIASVGVTAPDGSIQQAAAEILVRDFLIAGLGDSVAAGEGNPDKPVALSEIGFCFRDFLGGPGSQFYRPGRARYGGDKSCGTAVGSGEKADALREWQRQAAGWMSASCHRSLYGYQIRAALELAVENPQIAVTFLPLACAGASIEHGLLGPQRIRECPPTARATCAGTVPGQIGQLTELMAMVQKQQPARKLDLILLTIGANDILFSGLVANVIIEQGSERALFNRAGAIATPDASARITDADLPGAFAKLRAALKPLVGGNLARVVFTTYGNLALGEGGEPCPGGRDGFDVHPTFNADPARLKRVANFISDKFLPKIRALTTCEGTTLCGQRGDRMTFVDSHRPAVEAHGFCVRSNGDPDFDRECFSSDGKSFEDDIVQGAASPLVCGRKPSEFRPYAPRARWVRTANDSYFTAMTYPDGLPSVLQPADIHDATWGILSAVYGGAVHPTAEGHAAMADAALPVMRSLLEIPQPPAVTVEPLPPPSR